MPGLWCASEKDIPDLVEMAREFFLISPFKDKRFSPGGTERYLRSIIEDRHSVIFRTDQGAIGGTVEQLPFCVSIMARELFWFALGSGDGLQLLKQYEKWAIKHGADVIKMAALDTHGPAVEKVNKVLERMGYTRIEYGYVKGK